MHDAPGSQAVLDQLIGVLSDHMDLVPASLEASGDVVQIQLGARPVLYVNTADTPEEQAYGILEALRVLVLGWENVAGAHLIRHLRPCT